MANPLQIASALSLKQLTYLVTVAETLNFTRAAARCFVTQSTLSGGVSELERFLGAKLIERDRQHVMLTPLGLELVERARVLLGAAADFVNTAQTASSPAKGTVTIGAIPTIAPFLLPPFLRQMRERFPDLKTLLREDQTIRLVDAVSDGEVDFAIIALPHEIGRLRAYPLFSEALCLIMSEKDSLAPLVELRMSQIDMNRLMLLAEGHCLRDHVLQACHAGLRGRKGEQSEIAATSIATLVQMVEAGLGISLLPEMAIESGLLSGTRVVARPLAPPAPKREIALITRPTNPRIGMVEDIQEIMKSEVKYCRLPQVPS